MEDNRVCHLNGPSAHLKRIELVFTRSSEADWYGKVLDWFPASNYIKYKNTSGTGKKTETSTIKCSERAIARILYKFFCPCFYIKH